MNDNNNTKHRLLIVDDHPIVRHGLKEVINQEDDLEVCAEAESFQGAIERINSHKPDMALIDISIKGTNGLELVKKINKTSPLPMLVISIHDESLYAERALRAGAKGYIMKEEATEKLLIAIRCVLKGDIYLSSKMGEHMLHKYIDGKVDNSRSPLSCLTNREIEIFRLIGLGNSTKEIAKDLKLSIKTIESHRAHIKNKLKLKNALELIHHAIQWVQNEGAPLAK